MQVAKKKSDTLFIFFDISDMLIDQLVILDKGIEIASKYLRMNFMFTLASHNLIAFYTEKMRSFDKRDRMYNLNMAACKLLQRLAYTLAALSREEFDGEAVMRAMARLENEISKKLNP